MAESIDGHVMKLRNRVKLYRDTYPDENKMIGIYIDELEALLDYMAGLEKFTKPTFPITVAVDPSGGEVLGVAVEPKMFQKKPSD